MPTCWVPRVCWPHPPWIPKGPSGPFVAQVSQVVLESTSEPGNPTDNNWPTKKNVTLSLGPHLSFRRSLFSTAFSIRRRRCLAGVLRDVASFDESKVEENVEMGPWNVKDLQYILGFNGVQYDLMVLLGIKILQTYWNVAPRKKIEK
jgi:hypothetical protein